MGDGKPKKKKKIALHEGRISEQQQQQLPLETMTADVMFNALLCKHPSFRGNAWGWGGGGEIEQV